MSGESTPTMMLSYGGVCFDLFGTLVDGDGHAVEGARQALDTLSGVRYAIVTSCGREYAETLLAHARLPRPAVLVTSESVAHGKPAPDPYALGARELGLAVNEVVAVEDSIDGIESARGAQLDVIAILRGRGLAFAQRASFQVERFADIGWLVEKDGSIRVQIEP